MASSIIGGNEDIAITFINTAPDPRIKLLSKEANDIRCHQLRPNKGLESQLKRSLFADAVRKRLHTVLYEMGHHEEMSCVGV